MRKAWHATWTVDAEVAPALSVFCKLQLRKRAANDTGACPYRKPMNRFTACGDLRGRQRPKDRKDDQGRNDRVVQIGPNGLAASAHVMGCPEDRGLDWGYRRRCLSNAVGCPDRGRETARSLGIQ